ncbi:hypothetical protein HYT18_02640 [Candidatus Microgenomates bacterium]|nr:hypothetical protein [Candidatus Microgenomates bacterium]
MGQISKYPISKDVADRIFDVFIKSFIKVKNDKDAQILANDLFTPTERIMLAKRLAIAFCLMQGYEYREISKLLRVSVTTVASVNMTLKYGSNGYRTILERINKEEKLEDLFKNIAEKVLAMGSYGKGSGTWRYLRAEVQKSRDKKLKKPF